MEWAPEITTTVGGVLIGFLYVLNRFLGQQADPQVFALAQSVMDASNKTTKAITDANEKTDARWQEIIQNVTATMAQNTTVMEAVRTGILSIATRLESSEGVQQRTIDEVMRIAPKIDELTQAQTAKTKQSEGLQKVMDKAITSQVEILKEIRAAVLRLEAGFAEFKKDNSEKLEKFEQDVAAIKVDLGKVQAPSTPEPPIAPKPKTEEKDKPNE